VTGFLRALAERVAGEPHEWHAHVPARFEAVQAIALEDQEQAAGDAPPPALVLETPPTTAPAEAATPGPRERPLSPSIPPHPVDHVPPPSAVAMEGTAPAPAVEPPPERRAHREQPTRAAAAARPVVRVTLDDIGGEAEPGSIAPPTSPGRRPTPAPAATAAAAARPAEPTADRSPAPSRAPRSTTTPLTPATPPRSRDRPDDDRRAPATPAPIHVRIGRVDVRAVMAPEPVAPVVRTPAPSRGPDLEEYLGSTGRPAL
jgi:hypothetical protein